MPTYLCVQTNHIQATAKFHRGIFLHNNTFRSVIQAIRRLFMKKYPTYMSLRGTLLIITTELFVIIFDKFRERK